MSRMMSYCMFENTYRDLLECQQELKDNNIEDLEENASKYEKPFIKKLINLCCEIAENYDYQNEE